MTTASPWSTRPAGPALADWRAPAVSRGPGRGSPTSPPSPLGSAGGCGGRRGAVCTWFRIHASKVPGSRFLATSTRSRPLTPLPCAPPYGWDGPDGS
eukprot:6883946-Alexandrium_andersonii.AAC.1